MSISNNSQEISIQSFTQYLVDLAEQPSPLLDTELLEHLDFMGIDSFMLQSAQSTLPATEEIILLGIGGRITKRAIPVISSNIRKKLTDLQEAHKHLAVILDSDTVIDFAFYKLLTDLMDANQIVSLTIFSKSLNKSIELGIEFVQNFTAKHKINYIVNAALPVTTLLNSHSLSGHTSTSH